MADYYTMFSCNLDVGDEANVDRALQLFDKFVERGIDDMQPYGGFDVFKETINGRPQLWIGADEQGDVERVIEFVKLCAAEFDLKGRWGFEYACTCSKLRLGGFSGGAHVIDFDSGSSDWVDTSHWLSLALDGGTD